MFIRFHLLFFVSVSLFVGMQMDVYLIQHDL